MKYDATGVVGTRIVSVRADPLDLRDLVYRPALLELRPTYLPQELPPYVRDQIVDGPCTGFALANVIDMQNLVRSKRTDQSFNPASQVSARMLYEMARSHDEFADDLPGSSIRGAVKGFYHNGVAPEDSLEDTWLKQNWTLKIERAKAARNVGLGSYYRLSPLLNDYHAAINEVGAILVSAIVHDGWTPEKLRPAKTMDNKPLSYLAEPNLEIAWSSKSQASGGHAFAIVGYDELGFIVLNSWGYGWGGFNGNRGLARWTYEDWAENVMDAWVLRLSAPTPRAFDLTIGPRGLANRAKSQTSSSASVNNLQVLGHYINVDDGQLKAKGAHPSTAISIAETASYLKSTAGRTKYQHLLLYAHGGLNSEKDAIGQVAMMKEVWKRNGVYPVHFIWNTGAVGEAGDVMERIFTQGRERVGSVLSDAADKVLEKLTAPIGRALWREMKQGAIDAFDTSKVSRGKALEPTLGLITAARVAGMKVHLVGHSAGSILLGHLASIMSTKGLQVPNSVSLLAPACTVDFFETVWGSTAIVPECDFGTYILSDELEREDRVLTYNKSLLYLVSRAYEDEFEAPIFGMQTHLMPFLGKSPRFSGLKAYISTGKKNVKETRATTHATFDDDAITLNHVLERMLGAKTPYNLRFSHNF